MKAILCRVTVPRYLFSQTLGRLSDRFLLGPAGPLALQEMSLPPLLTPRYVRVRTTLTGICGSDVGLLRGRESYSLDPFFTFPSVLGHEAVGVVAETGAEASRFRPGDRVALSPYIGCLDRGTAPPCRVCAEGRSSSCEKQFEGPLAPGLVGMNRDLPGTWAEYFAVPETLLEPIPESVPDEEAVLCDPLVCALHGLLRAAPRPGETVLVIGAGTIGLCLIAGIRAMGFSARVLVQSRYAFQSELATKLGADEILPSGAAGLRRLAEITSARVLKPRLGPPVLEGGVDLAYDCVGSPASLDQALRVVRTRGRVMMIGAIGPAGGADLAPLWFREITLLGVYGGGTEEIQGERLSTLRLALKLMGQKKLNLRPLLTHQFPLSRFQEALRIALHHPRHQSVKVALKPAQG
jgi:threonine dehydrogenase-like Zn-dependent dehydrogenase